MCSRSKEQPVHLLIQGDGCVVKSPRSAEDSAAMFKLPATHFDVSLVITL